MKRSIYAILALGLLLTSSCAKNTSSNSPLGSGGSWTFKGKTYHQTSCYAYNNGVFVATSSNPGSTMIFSFYDTIPTSPGTYAEYVTHNEQIRQVSIEFDDSATGMRYYPSDIALSTVPVSITVSSAGKRKMSAANVTLINSMSSADTAGLTLSITEQ